ncbi:MAG: glycosyltransferase family 39 protein, partial [Alteromonas sp.]|nr:glycosyltransferase family 39 protein [Alteromonas sp.]
TGNWLTPMFDYDVPFWGKPPMFTWLSAIGIEVLGVSEFAVRFPHWLVGVFTLLICTYFAKRVGVNALMAAMVLSTTAIFAIAAGAVMTDMILTCSLALAMTGFYFCWRGEKIWGYVGFFGLGLALLSKGPVAVVIMGLGVFPFLVIQHGFIGAFVELWKRFPVVGGLALMTAVALPWYLMAEQATPGFIDYFIVGEHYKRFVVSGWEGDLYGNAHDEPRGKIWLYWLQAAAPWSIALPIIAWRRRAKVKEVNAENPGLMTFLTCWLIAPMILFTFAGNILPAYVLPGIPAIGMLVAAFVKEDEKWVKGLGCVVPTLLIIAVCVIMFKTGNERSDKMLFANIDHDKPTFYVAGNRPFSGQYYSFGQAQRLSSSEDLQGHDNGYYIIGPNERIKPFIEKEQLSCTFEIESPKRSRYLCQ